MHDDTPRQISRVIAWHGSVPARAAYDIPVSRRTGSRFFTCDSGVIPQTAQDWLKKPFSISRARSSAETSTLRGVSRNTLSAIRCMPPSSA